MNDIDRRNIPTLSAVLPAVAYHSEGSACGLLALHARVVSGCREAGLPRFGIRALVRLLAALGYEVRETESGGEVVGLKLTGRYAGNRR